MKKAIYQIISLFIVVSVIFSCGKNVGNTPASPVSAPEESYLAKKSEIPGNEKIISGENNPVNGQIKKKIIKDGRMGFRVENLENAKKNIDNSIKKFDGYYSSEVFNNTDYESSYNLKIRVPADKFETMLAEIESGEVEITFKEIQANDVTTQFIDTETRLANKRSYLNRYNELLKQAKNVEEILSIEEKIRALQEETESAEGTLKFLNDQVAFSTLDLTLSKIKDFKFNPEKRIHFFEKLKQSLSGGWFGFVSFILLLIRVWPFWVIVAIILLIIRKYQNKKTDK